MSKRRRRNHRQISDDRLPKFTLIEKATGGNVEALNEVVDHYGWLISRLSTRKFTDEYGNPHYLPDDEIRRTLETSLIVNILSFDPRRKMAQG